MSWIVSTPQSRQPLDHDTPWERFKHAVSAAMCKAGWPGGPAWELADKLESSRARVFGDGQASRSDLDTIDAVAPPPSAWPDRCEVRADG